MYCWMLPVDFADAVLGADILSLMWNDHATCDVAKGIHDRHKETYRGACFTEQ